MQINVTFNPRTCRSYQDAKRAMNDLFQLLSSCALSKDEIADARMLISQIDSFIMDLDDEFSKALERVNDINVN